MLYITNEELPEKFRNDNGLNLCKLWFWTSQGHDIKSLKEKDLKFDDNFISLREVSQYRIVDKEILLLGNSYVVGDGLGNIIYSPCRNNSDIINYLEGNIGITKKFEVIFNNV